MFADRFELEEIQQRVKRTNIYYGALSPHVNNVLCVQGSADPWHLVGYYKNITTGMDSLFIPGTAHCADMYQPSPKDSPALKEARQIIIQYINNLLYGNVSSEETSTPSQTTQQPAGGIQVQAGSASVEHLDAGDEFMQEINPSKESNPIAVTIEQTANTNVGSNSNEQPNSSQQQNGQMLTINIFEGGLGNQVPLNSPPVPNLQPQANAAGPLPILQANQPPAEITNWVTTNPQAANENINIPFTISPGSSESGSSGGGHWAHHGW